MFFSHIDLMLFINLLMNTLICLLKQFKFHERKMLPFFKFFFIIRVKLCIRIPTNVNLDFKSNSVICV